MVVRYVARLLEQRGLRWLLEGDLNEYRGVWFV